MTIPGTLIGFLVGMWWPDSHRSKSRAGAIPCSTSRMIVISSPAQRPTIEIRTRVWELRGLAKALIVFHFKVVTSRANQAALRVPVESNSIVAEATINRRAHLRTSSGVNSGTTLSMA